jgi:hypothetical protein
MSEIYTKYNFDLDLIKRNKLLGVLCMSADEFLRHIEVKDLSIINLGLDLSRRLKEYPMEYRNSKVLDELTNILAKAQTEYIVVKNIDILFNPDYKLNILSYFINLSRSRLIFVEWPGRLKGRMLEYADINSPDYHKYNIDDYKIILIK